MQLSILSSTRGARRAARCAIRAGALLLAAFGLFGCAIGNTFRYSEVVGTLQQAGTEKVAVAVHDRRPYVTSGEKTPAYCGIIRGWYYNPIDAVTATMAPLADDMTRSICNSLKKRGFQAEAVKVSAGEPSEDVEKKLAEIGADRSVLVELNEWRSETFINTAMSYNVSIVLRRQSQNRKAQNSQSGHESLGGSLWTPAGHARIAVPEFFKRKIEEWLNDASAQEILP